MKRIDAIKIKLNIINDTVYLEIFKGLKMHQSIKIRWEPYKFLCIIFDEMPNLQINIIIPKNFKLLYL